MFKIEILKNGKHYKKIAIANEITIKELAKTEIEDSFERLAFKLNREFITDNYVLKSDAALDCIGYTSLDGHRLYQDSALFILMKAFHNLYSNENKIVVEHSIGNGIYCEIFGNAKLTEESALNLETEMKNIVKRKLPIIKEKHSFEDARRIFADLERTDIIRNLDFLHSDVKNVYRCGEFYDYYIRHLVDNTELLKSFKIRYKSPGFILQLPAHNSKDIEIKDFQINLFSVHQEYDKWLNILRSHNVADLNDRCKNYSIKEMIQVEEALQEKKVVYFADYVKEKKDVKMVLIAGPSSSGKTTFAKRLSIQLRVNNLIPVIIGLDDYFLPRHLTPKTEDGDYDFETIDALDIELLNKHLGDLLEGKEVELPRFNFVSGQREQSGHFIKLEDNQVLVLEGIHAINEKLTFHIPKKNKVKIYISCLNQLNIDFHNRIPTTDNRKLRRICRDYQYRGYSAEETLGRWESIRNGEEKHIFPFQEQADLIFNSGLTYEIAVLKKYAKPVLEQVSIYSPVYSEARRLSLLLDHFTDIPDDLVPGNSLIREFTKGSIFSY